MSEEAVMDAVETPEVDDYGVEQVVTGPSDSGAESTAQEPSIEERFAELEGKYNADQKRFDNAQQLIQRQGAELGQYRNQVSQQDQAKDPAKFLEDFADNPQQVIEQELARRESERHSQSSQNELAALQAKQQVMNFAPDIEDSIPAIQEWYREKGGEMPTNLFGNTDAAVALAELVKVRAELATLKANNSHAGAESRLDKMQAAAKRGRNVGGKSGGAVVGTRDLSSIDPTKMSDADLKTALAELSQ